MNIYDEMRAEIAQLNMWTKAYDEGKPLVSDREWDYHYFALAELERKTGIYLSNSPTQSIDYQVVSELKKVKHNHPMLSLDKTKDFSEFKEYFDNINNKVDVVTMLKLDGLTCSLRYINGELVSAETRGNGEIGEDILHNALVIRSIPNRIDTKEEIIVDGEIISNLKNFENFKSDYKNPRNFAAGSIRLLDSKECERRGLTFVVWNVIKGFSDSNSFTDKLERIGKLGFDVVPFVSSLDSDTIEELKYLADKMGYPIDGIVGRFDDIQFGESLGSTGHHSRAAFAFKFYDELYPTKLIDIEWSMGRTGVFTPVAIFEPIDIDGTEVSRASLHNFSVMEELNGGYSQAGDTLYIYKANSIIPQVDKWVHDAANSEKDKIDMLCKCPVCGESIQLSESESGTKNLFCANPDCDGKIINKLDHYCSKNNMEIKGLSKATLEKLINWGWVSCISEIYSLSNFQNEWQEKPGFGEKSVNNIINAIEKSRQCELYNFISAIGIPEVGANTAKILAKEFGSWESFRDAVRDKNYNFSSISGFGYETNKYIKSFNYREADYIYSNFLTISEPANDTVESSSLDGLTFVITGKLAGGNRDWLKGIIESAGGKVGSTINNKTNYLISNDKDSKTAKTKKALELGIAVLTEEEFFKKFDF